MCTVPSSPTVDGISKPRDLPKGPVATDTGYHSYQRPIAPAWQWHLAPTDRAAALGRPGTARADCYRLQPTLSPTVSILGKRQPQETQRGRPHRTKIQYTHSHAHGSWLLAAQAGGASSDDPPPAR